MFDPITLLKTRDAGQGRYALLATASLTRAAILAAFGLAPTPDALTQISAEHAEQILTTLLWKDAAYNIELMPRAEAAALAKTFLDHHAIPAATFHTNQSQTFPGAWNPLTNATFDSGILILRPDDIAACLWFEDED